MSMTYVLSLLSDGLTSADRVALHAGPARRHHQRHVMLHVMVMHVMLLLLLLHVRSLSNHLLLFHHAKHVTRVTARLALHQRVDAVQ